MTSRPRALTASTAVAAVAVAAIGLGVLGGPDPSPAANPREEADAVRTGCAQQSSFKFGDAYADPGNLVTGPLALVGGATFTDAATARRFGANKYPLLVRAGHTVTVSVPPSARWTASLGYGRRAQGRALGQRDGHHAVTFVACSAAESSSTAGGPVTFWSGFVMVSVPACVPLDVYADDNPRPRRVKIELGRRCPGPPPLRDCAVNSRRQSSDGGGRHNHRQSDPQSTIQARAGPPPNRGPAGRAERHRPTRPLSH
jgi:hypothetical protein